MFVGFITVLDSHQVRGNNNSCYGKIESEEKELGRIFN